MVSNTTVSIENDMDKVEKDELTEEELLQREYEALKNLKNLMQEDAQLKTLTLDDDIQLLLLRTRFGRPTAALRLIKTIIDYKQKTYPELFEKVHPDCIKHVLEKRIISVLKQTVEGPTVLVIHIDRWNTSEASFDELIIAGLLYGYELVKGSVKTQRDGIVMVIDVSGFGFSHARQCSYGNISKMVNCIIFGGPFRISQCHIVHSPYVFEKVWQVVKYAIPEKYRKFATVTRNDLSQLHKIIPVETLPESLGGKVTDKKAWEQGLEKQITENAEVYKFSCQLTKDIGNSEP